MGGLMMYKDTVGEVVATIGQNACEETLKMCGDLEAALLDTKGIMKDESRWAELVDFPDRSLFLDRLKQLQGAGGAGLKRLERVIAALSSTDLAELLKTLGAARDRAKKVRQAARFQVCCRSGIVIVQRNAYDRCDI